MSSQAKGSAFFVKSIARLELYKNEFMNCHLAKKGGVIQI